MELSKSYAAADYGATLLRISLGIMYLAHAHLKFFVFGLAGTAEFFASVGFPAWSAYPVAFAEAIGGIALFLGLKARWVALALTPILIGALITHWPNGAIFTNPKGGWEYPAFLIVASVLQGLLGDGAFALRGSPNRSTRMAHA